LSVPGVTPPPSATLQAFVQLPQWFGSFARFSQSVPPSLATHFVVGDSHAALHAPLEQT
jgi:hypothetical protein